MRVTRDIGPIEVVPSRKARNKGKKEGCGRLPCCSCLCLLYSIRYQGVRAGIRGEEGASRPKIDKDGKRRATGLRLLYFSAAPVPEPKPCLGLCFPLSDGELVPNVEPSDAPSKHARCCRDQVGRHRFFGDPLLGSFLDLRW